MEHFNEPWNRGIGNEAHYVYGTKGELIADTFKGLTNGSRIVAAVNHAEGYTNEQLKAVSMKDMITNIEDLHHIASFVVSPDPDINRQVRNATINAAKLLSHLRGIEAP